MTNTIKITTENYKGKTFGKWTILDVVIKQDNKNKKRKFFLCICSCELKTQKLVRTDIILGKQSLSCGCIQKEKASEIGKTKKKYNIYDLSKEYGIGFATNTNAVFYFDLEDYDSIKIHAWAEDKDGYLKTNINRKPIYMHRFLLNLTKENSAVVDHKNRNRKDNRRNNIKVTDYFENNHNQNKKRNNKSGKKGVHKHSTVGYVAEIIYKGNKRIKYFVNLTDAINQRKEWELELFGYYFDN